MAPTGPLAELRDELDDTFVDEDKCLRLLGQLGDGERILVGRDATMMQQMADAFNAGEMSRAIEQVKLTIKWQMHWLSRASKLDDYDQGLLTRLLNAADAPVLGELIGWDDVRREGAQRVARQPARAPRCRRRSGEHASLARHGRVHEVGQRARRSTGARAVDRGQRSSGIARGDQDRRPLGSLLDAISDEPTIRPVLKQLFVAATAPDDRRRLYEIRFNTRAAGTIDWMANGEGLWTQQELATGTGGDRAAVTAAVAAGGPAGRQRRHRCRLALSARRASRRARRHVRR